MGRGCRSHDTRRVGPLLLSAGIPRTRGRRRHRSGERRGIRRLSARQRTNLYRALAPEAGHPAGCSAGAARWPGSRLSLLFPGTPDLPAVKETDGGPAGLADCPAHSWRGDLPMALYMYQASYTAEAIAALVQEPQDRIEAARSAIEGIGGKLVAAGYPFGDYDAIVLFEAPDDTTAAGFALAIAAGGAGKSAKTTRLLSGQEWIESVRKAPGSQHRPPQ